MSKRGSDHETKHTVIHIPRRYRRGLDAGDGHCPRRNPLHRLRQARFHLTSREDGHDQARHRRNQGDRRGGLHLRPADRDELRGHVRVRRRHATRASTRRRSIRSTTKPASSPTRTRPSSRPTATRPIRMLWLDLRAEPIVLSVPAVEKERYYSVMLCDGNTFNYGYIGSRATGSEAGDYMVVGPDWKGETPAGHQEGVPFHHAVLGGDLPHAALQSGRHAERGEGPVRLQGAAALGLSQAARAAARPRRSTSRRSTRNW